MQQKKPNYKHGLRNTQFYRCRYNIDGRCNRDTPGSKDYKDRGIKCLRSSFYEFKKDMYDSRVKHVKEHGEKDTSINRIDNNGNYCKENCERATNAKQMLNTSNNLILEKDGIKKTAKEWSIELGINENTIRVRHMRGLDPLIKGKVPKKTTIMPYYNRHKELFGDKSKKYIEIYHRIKKYGRDIERAINTQ